MKSLNTSVQQKGIESLGDLGSSRITRLLIELLKHEEIATIRSGVAKSAAKGLCKLNTTETVKPLIVLSKWQNYHDSYRRAAEILNSLKLPKTVDSLESLIAELKDKNRFVRRKAAEALGKLGNPKAIEPLIEILEDEAEEVRSSAAEALGNLGDPKAIEPIIKMLEDENKKVRSNAAVALKKLGASKTVESILIRLANSNQVDDRKQAAEILGHFSTEPDIPLLVTLLDDNNLEVRLQAVESLGKIKAVTVLHERFATTTNAKIQKAIVAALTQIASSDSVPVLRAAVTDPDISIPARFAALATLQNIVAKDTFIAIILEAVQQDEAVLGLRIYNMLGKFKARQALPLLHNRLTKLQQQADRWRKIRDKERQYFTEAETEAWQQKLEEAQPAFHWAFELAYAIAQIDPDASGIRLLSHDLADVRHGAWMSLGEVGSVALVQHLDTARTVSENPFFRHAAYRAIDHILNRLEVTGGEKELNALKALSSKVKDKEGVQTRVAWTIQQLEHSMDILKEFPQLMGKENIHTQIAQKVRELVCNNISRQRTSFISPE